MKIYTLVEFTEDEFKNHDPRTVGHWLNRETLVELVRKKSEAKKKQFTRVKDFFTNEEHTYRITRTKESTTTFIHDATDHIVVYCYGILEEDVNED